MRAGNRISRSSSSSNKIQMVSLSIYCIVLRCKPISTYDRWRLFHFLLLLLPPPLPEIVLLFVRSTNMYLENFNNKKLLTIQPFFFSLSLHCYCSDSIYAAVVVVVVYFCLVIRDCCFFVHLECCVCAKNLLYTTSASAFSLFFSFRFVFKWFIQLTLSYVHMAIILNSMPYRWFHAVSTFGWEKSEICWNSLRDCRVKTCKFEAYVSTKYGQSPHIFISNVCSRSLSRTCSFLSSLDRHVKYDNRFAWRFLCAYFQLKT